MNRAQMIDALENWVITATDEERLSTDLMFARLQRVVNEVRDALQAEEALSTKCARKKFPLHQSAQLLPPEYISARKKALDEA